MPSLIKICPTPLIDWIAVVLKGDKISGKNMGKQKQNTHYEVEIK